MRKSPKRKLIGFIAGEKGSIGKLQALALGMGGVISASLIPTKIAEAFAHTNSIDVYTDTGGHGPEWMDGHSNWGDSDWDYGDHSNWGGDGPYDDTEPGGHYDSDHWSNYTDSDHSDGDHSNHSDYDDWSGDWTNSPPTVDDVKAT